MKMKLFVVSALLVMLIAAGAAVSFADCGGCGKAGQGAGEAGCMVSKKAEVMLKNQAELGLTQEQISKIKVLKMQYKKDMITQQAAIEVLAVDIKEKMYDDAIDTEAVNALIDRKYELKKSKAKANVAALAQLKGVLSEEQRKTLKTLYKQCSMGK